MSNHFVPASMLITLEGKPAEDMQWLLVRIGQVVPLEPAQLVSLVAVACRALDAGSGPLLRGALDALKLGLHSGKLDELLAKLDPLVPDAPEDGPCRWRPAGAGDLGVVWSWGQINPDDQSEILSSYPAVFLATLKEEQQWICEPLEKRETRAVDAAH